MISEANSQQNRFAWHTDTQRVHILDTENIKLGRSRRSCNFDIDECYARTLNQLAVLLHLGLAIVSIKRLTTFDIAVDMSSIATW